jgi:hypothetical protein
LEAVELPAMVQGNDGVAGIAVERCGRFDVPHAGNGQFVVRLMVIDGA